MNNDNQMMLYVLPEDDAYRDMVTGFRRHPLVREDKIKILPSAKGWKKTLEQFRDRYAPLMSKAPDKRIYMLILMDFDGKPARRLEIFKDFVDIKLRRKVFLFGSRNEAEDLKRALGGGKSRDMGNSLAEFCINPPLAGSPWKNLQMDLNTSEIERLKRKLAQTLFK